MSINYDVVTDYVLKKITEHYEKERKKEGKLDRWGEGINNRSGLYLPALIGGIEEEFSLSNHEAEVLVQKLKDEDKIVSIYRKDIVLTPKGVEMVKKYGSYTSYKLKAKINSVFETGAHQPTKLDRTLNRVSLIGNLILLSAGIIVTVSLDKKSEQLDRKIIEVRNLEFQLEQHKKSERHLRRIIELKSKTNK